MNRLSGSLRRSALAVGLVCALIASTSAAAAWEHTKVSFDIEPIVLLGGCDGLIAPGGVAPTSPGPAPYAYTHNFIASAHVEGHSRSDPEVANSLNFRGRVTGSGVDGAGSVLEIRGSLTMESFVPDFFATDGNVTIRRDDGSFARGSAFGAHSNVIAGEFVGFDGPALFITASKCHLR